MWFQLREVGLGFIEDAGKTYVMECEVAATRREVWELIVDPSTWVDWFPGGEAASYGDSPEPYGVGTRRRARVGGHDYDEVIVAWEPEARWAYTIARATVPIATAQLECTELEDTEAGTRVRWILAADRRLLMWLLAPFLQRQLQHLWSRAMRNLEATLRERRAADGGDGPDC
jgi:carbon monoxide dehydrogenase subunit G